MRSVRAMKNKRNTMIIIAVLLLFTAISFILLVRTVNKRTEADTARVCSSVHDAICSKTGEIRRQISADAIETLPFAIHVYSHRGGSDGTAEEHSTAAYDHAIEFGSVNIEQDIVISADGTLYVSHDTTPYRLTGTGGSFAQMHDSEIDALRTHQGNPILKLEDVFERYGNEINYVVELKDGSADKAFEELVKEFGYEDIVIVQSFDPGVLKAIEDVFPDMKKIYLCKKLSEMSAGLDMEYVDILGVDKSLMSSDNCKLAHDRGKDFCVWTLDTGREIRTAIELGADTYFTNYTERAMKVEREYRYAQN